MKLTYYKKKKNLEKIVKLQQIVIKNRFQRKREIIDYYNTPEKMKSIIFLQQFMVKRYFSYYRNLMFIIILRYFVETLKINIDLKNLDKVSNKNIYCIYSYVLFMKEGKFLFDIKPGLQRDINK